MPDPNKYTIGWICAISTEFVAARALFDEQHDALESTAGCDNNNYALGRMGKHNVVIAVLPKAEYGTTTAATVARDMLHTFSSIRLGVMVGIGGGAPSAKHDIRLGDVVVNTSGVFQYDYGKEIQGRTFETTGSLNKPPQLLLTAISALEAEYELEGHQLNKQIETTLQQRPRLRKKYSRPSSDSDRLYPSHILHPALPGECIDLCDGGFQSLEDRGQRNEQDDPAIHYGLIASSNRLMKNALVRDSLVAERGVLCFEMEAAGLANHFPCVVIRGICDYADSHKNKKWQGFASMVAAAYAKDLLYQILPSRVQAEMPIEETLKSIQAIATITKDTVMSMASDDHNHKILSWLDPPDYSSNANRARRSRHRGTGSWFVNSPEFQGWRSGLYKQLWLYGLVGCGKTVLSTNILDVILTSDENTTLAFFFDFDHSRKQTLDGLLRSLAGQLYFSVNEAAKKLDNLYDFHNGGQRQPDTTALSDCLDAMIDAARPVFIVIDALDECTNLQKVLRWLDHSTSSKARILVTSRPEENLKSRLFQLFGKDNCICFDKRAIDADIYSYVDAELETRSEFVKLNLSPQLKDAVRFKVGAQADGMFRWAACQLEVLATCLSTRDIKLALESLPSSLDETYERMIALIPPEWKATAIRLLQFVVHAESTIKVKEALEIIATQIDQEPRGFSVEGRLLQPHDVLRYCPGLMVIAETRTSNSQNLAGGVQEESIAITSTYLTYLGDIDDCTTEDLHKVTIDFPLAKYAAQLWTKYAILAGDSEDTTKTVVGFLRDKIKLQRWIRLCFPYPGGYYGEPGAAMLYYACWYDLIVAVRHLIAEVDNVDALGAFGTPLQLAAWNGNLQIAHLLLERGADVHAEGGIQGTALHQAAYRGDLKMVQLLLEKGADVNFRGNLNHNNLVAACAIGKREVIKLLLSKGADINATSALCGTALMATCYQGKVETVQLLLDSGADVNVQDAWFGNALHVAVRHGFPRVVQLLLDNGADVDMHHAGGTGTTAVQIAMSRGYLNIVQMLSKAGASEGKEGF